MGLSLGVPEIMVKTRILVSTEAWKSFRATEINFVLQRSRTALLEKEDNTSPKDFQIIKLGNNFQSCELEKSLPLGCTKGIFFP